MNRFRGKALVILAVTVFLWGCHSGNSSSNGHPTTKTDNVLNRGNGAEPQSLDPGKSEDVFGANILNDLFEGLTVETPDNKIAPGVAERWDISSDGKTYTFYLRQDAKWSNGESLTADDFVYGMRRAVSPKTAGPQVTLLYPILHAKAISQNKMPPESLAVKALDKYTLEIKLEAPTPYFLQLMAAPTAFPIYKPNVDRYGNQFTQAGHLVSNGAYKLKEWVVNDHITVVRNPYYWDNVHTSIDTVNYYPTPDTTSELKQYQAGQLDYTFQIPSDGFQALKKEYPTELHISPWASTFYYVYNLTKPPFKDQPGLRQALSMVIDRDVLTQSVAPIGNIPQYYPVPQGMGVNTDQLPEWTHWPMQKRIAEAQKLYAQAGYSKDHPLKIVVLSKNNDQTKKILIAMQSMWHDALGVDVQLRSEEWKSFVSDYLQGNFDIGTMSWVGDYNDPLTFLGLMLCNNPQNPGKYCDPQYDRLVNEASHTPDENKRKALYEKAAQIEMNAYPMVNLFQEVITHLVKPYVGNYQQTQILDHVHSKNWKINK